MAGRNMPLSAVGCFRHQPALSACAVNSLSISDGYQAVHARLPNGLDVRSRQPAWSLRPRGDEASHGLSTSPFGGRTVFAPDHLHHRPRSRQHVHFGKRPDGAARLRPTVIVSKKPDQHDRAQRTLTL